MQRFSKLTRGLEYTATLLFFCVVLQTAVLASSHEKSPQRPRITGIDHVSIYVSDIEKSRHFYSGVLGLTTTNCPRYTRPEPCYLVAPSEQRVLLKRAPGTNKRLARRSRLCYRQSHRDAPLPAGAWHASRHHSQRLRRFTILPDPRPGRQSHCLRATATCQDLTRAGIQADQYAR